jgi:GTP-binding protein HflX
MSSGAAQRQSAFLVGLQASPAGGAAAANGRGAAPAGSAPEPVRWDVEQCLDELARLADSAGLVIAGRTWQRRAQPDPRTYLGAGKLAEVAGAARAAGAEVVLFDDELTPSQLRNVEQSLGDELLAVDRTALILDIFARHARSREGQLQVELAQLEYRLPRLTRLWTHLARQAGGRAGMGVGLRGPGEAQIEVDRRRIRQRLSVLRTHIRSLSQRRRHGRARRHQSGSPVLALVGYTNAGKSSLMRALSGAAVLVQDQLFATLDSTTRTVELNRGKVLLTDTVGFIRRLPHHLFASFRATLEEAAVADLLLHVVDLSHPYYESQIETVEKVLRDLQFKPKSTLLVYNKFDQVECGEAGNESPIHSEKVVTVSALTGFGIDLLKEKIEEVRLSDSITLDLQIPQQEGRLLSRLRAQGEVLAQDFHNDEVLLRLRLDKTWVERWQLHRFAPALGRARQ